MADPQWPILSKYPSIEGYRRGIGTDNTNRSGTEGRPLTSAGCSPILDKLEFTLRFLTPADKRTLDAFQKTQTFIGAIAFDYYDEVEEQWDSMKLGAQMVFELERGGVSWWTTVKMDQQPNY